MWHTDRNELAYPAKDATAAARGYEFQKEAKRLCRADKKDSIFTTAGLSLLYLSHRGHGQNEDEFTDEASSMAKRLRLFGVKNRLDAQEMFSVGRRSSCCITNGMGRFQLVHVSCQRSLWLSRSSTACLILTSIQVRHYISIPTECEPKLPMPNQLITDIRAHPQSESRRIFDISRVCRYLCELSLLQLQLSVFIRVPDFRKLLRHLQFQDTVN